jgi:hypothetical protein
VMRYEFYQQLAEYKERFPELRQGQAVFNLAYNLGLTLELDPLTFRAIDPFYNDGNIESFLYEIGIV